MTEEVTTEIDGWSVTYPAECNGGIADLGFVFHYYTLNYLAEKEA